MNTSLKKILWLLCSVFLVAQQTDFVNLVDPFIGTGGTGHTFPGAVAPFGMVQMSPNTSYKGWRASSGFVINDPEVIGFSHTHLSGTGATDLMDVSIFPKLEGNANTMPITEQTAKPGYYFIKSSPAELQVALTSSVRTGRMKITRLNDQKRIMLSLYHHITQKKPKQSQLFYNITTGIITGSFTHYGWAKGRQLFFYTKILQPHTLIHHDGKYVEVIFDKRINEVEVVTALSSVSIANAQLNFESEAKENSFNKILEQTQMQWQQWLSKIEIKNHAVPSDLVNFYTALYHAAIHPSTWSDSNGEYRGLDGKVHQTKTTQYTIFSLWDTYRALHPLLTILDPQRSMDFLESLLNGFEQQGKLPVWELHGRETDTMLGYHSVPVIADIWLKIAQQDGVLTPEEKDALAMRIQKAFKVSASQQKMSDLLTRVQNLPLNKKMDEKLSKFYSQHGYVSEHEWYAQVSKVLEYAYDDASIGSVLKSMNDPESEVYFKRGLNYKNVFDPNTQFFRPLKKGAFMKPFDPYRVSLSSAYFAESNAFPYRLSFTQNPLEFSSSALESMIDEVFNAKSELTGGKLPDITGLYGQYAHGNEPSHHIPFMYNTIPGSEWKTQKMTREIITKFYKNTPYGIEGNDDCGQMSAWYVLTSIGFYPLMPGVNTYFELTTPLFRDITLHIPSPQKNGGIQKWAIQSQQEGMYIQKVFSQGQALIIPRINTLDFWKPGGLTYNLSQTPNPQAFNQNASNNGIQYPYTGAFIPIPLLKTGSNRLRLDFENRLDGGTIHYSFNGKSFKQYANKALSVPLGKKMLYAYYEKEGHKGKTLEVNFNGGPLIERVWKFGIDTGIWIYRNLTVF